MAIPTHTRQLAASSSSSSSAGRDTPVSKRAMCPDSDPRPSRRARTHCSGAGTPSQAPRPAPGSHPHSRGLQRGGGGIESNLRSAPCSRTSGRRRRRRWIQIPTPSVPIVTRVPSRRFRSPSPAGPAEQGWERWWWCQVCLCLAFPAAPLARGPRGDGSGRTRKERAAGAFVQQGDVALRAWNTRWPEGGGGETWSAPCPPAVSSRLVASCSLGDGRRHGMAVVS
ncbi:hypothetical protein PVAP13_2KG203191 [Panicum virgatum]|uniref:Uncharacterized protein n=1 Tax=Panicum virgatum TaxID=38727 RepID=A0A8T0WAM8_PANVG|nr:hypothetical protein PVAP13_2KG203191 [Panicum virgatum]